MIMHKKFTQEFRMTLLRVCIVGKTIIIIKKKARRTLLKPICFYKGFGQKEFLILIKRKSCKRSSWKNIKILCVLSKSFQELNQTALLSCVIGSELIAVAFLQAKKYLSYCIPSAFCLWTVWELQLSDGNWGRKVLHSHCRL